MTFLAGQADLILACDECLSANDPKQTFGLGNLQPLACGKPHASYPSGDRASPSNVDRRLGSEKFSALRPSGGFALAINFVAFL